MANRPTIHIKEVSNRRDLERFVKVPWTVYREDPKWVPPLIMEQMGRLSRGKNPYFEHAQARYWIACRNGAAVGRISAQIDGLVEKHHYERNGHFGFFDCIRDQSVANALLDTACGWLRANGREKVTGPFNLSINEETGMLVHGFDTPPSLMMGHALPYFEELLINYGLEKAKDVWAYYLKIDQEILPPAIAKLIKRSMRDGRLRIRPIDMKHYDRDLRIILDIFNDGWRDNWGFLPLTDAELNRMARDMKPLIRKDFSYIAELDGEPAAMMVTLPNVNELIADLDGRLFPFGFLKLLWRLKIRPCYQTVRVPLMGVRKEHQNAALGGTMAFALIETCRMHAAKAGCTHAELSWVLEDNTRLQKMLESIGCTHYKTYRLFAKAL